MTNFRQLVQFVQAVNQDQLSVYMPQDQNLWRDVSVASFVLTAQRTELSLDVHSVSSQFVASALQIFVPYVHDVNDLTLAGLEVGLFHTFLYLLTYLVLIIHNYYNCI